jgi:hypothetical protein
VQALHAAGVDVAAQIGRIEPFSEGPSIWIRTTSHGLEDGQSHSL